MDAGDYIALGGTILALVFQSVGVAMFLSRLAAQVENQGRAIQTLADSKVSSEQGKGLQAQLDRLERNDAECEGKLVGMRQEFDARTERVTNRMTAHEQQQAAQTADLRGALSEIKATFTAGMTAMKEALDRMAAERAHPLPAATAPDFLQQLQQFVAIQKMLKGASA